MRQFKLPAWAKNITGAQACELCSGHAGIVVHRAPEDCPYLVKCVVCGDPPNEGFANQLVVLGYGSAHDGEAICVVCIDKWLDGLKA